jgi:hypothetical protein
VARPYLTGGELLETAKARLRVHRREFKEHFFNVFEIMDEIG